MESAHHVAPERTYILVLDGMEPDLIGWQTTPRLMQLMAGGEAAWYPNAQGSLPAETNPNHAAIATGAPGGLSGIVGNAFYDPRTRRISGTERPSLLLAETMFDAAARQGLRTAVVAGKDKLRRMFDCTRTTDPGTPCGTSTDNPEKQPVTHVRPDLLMGATTNPAEVLMDPDERAPADPVAGSTLDAAVMNQVLTVDAHITFVNMAQIDVTQHLFGAHSPEAIAAVRNADLQVGRLVDHLKATGRWSRTVLIVTADHSFQRLGGTGDAVAVGGVALSNPVTGQVTGSRIYIYEVVEDSRVIYAVAHGGVASLYLADPDDAAAAAEVRMQALTGTDELGRSGAVTAAYCRIPSDSCPGIPAGWGLDSRRAGDVVLVTDDDHVFHPNRLDVNGAITGHHGGPTALPVPLIVASGGSFLRAGEKQRPVSTRDIAATVGELYGLRTATGERFPHLPSWSRVLSDALVLAP